MITQDVHKNWCKSLLQRMQGLETGVRLSSQAGKTGPDLRCVTHRDGKGASPPLHSAGSGDPKVKSESIQGSYRRLLPLRIAEHTGKQQQRLRLLRIEFAHQTRGLIRKRVHSRPSVVARRDPTHRPEAPDKIDVRQ